MRGESGLAGRSTRDRDCHGRAPFSVLFFLSLCVVCSLPNLRAYIQRMNHTTPRDQTSSFIEVGALFFFFSSISTGKVNDVETDRCLTSRTSGSSTSRLFHPRAFCPALVDYGLKLCKIRKKNTIKQSFRFCKTFFKKKIEFGTFFYL